MSLALGSSSEQSRRLRMQPGPEQIAVACSVPCASPDRQARERALTCQVQFIQQHPVASGEGCQEGPLAPGKLPCLSPTGRQVCSQQIHHVCLLTQIDPHQLLTCNQA